MLGNFLPIYTSKNPSLDELFVNRSATFVRGTRNNKWCISFTATDEQFGGLGRKVARGLLKAVTTAVSAPD
jgi:hypothetical protein